MTTPMSDIDEMDEMVRKYLNTAVYFWEPKEGNLNLGTPHLGFEKLVKETKTSLIKWRDKAVVEARFTEAGLWLQMVTRNDHSRLDSNEWYKLNPQVVSKFFAERIKTLKKD